MRVTEQSNFESIKESIRKSKSRLEDLQTQSATLKKLNTPSDDPVGAAKVLEVRTDQVNNKQFHSNIKTAETFLLNTDQAVSDLVDIIIRAKELALSQSSGASSSESTRMAVAEEVTQLFNQGLSVANRKIGNQYILAGFQTDKAPVNNEGQYLGDHGKKMTEVSKGIFISMNIPGAEIFNTKPSPLQNIEAGFFPKNNASGQNVNFFEQLQRLKGSLVIGDTDGIRNSIDAFDQLRDRMVSIRSKVGSRLSGMEGTEKSLERSEITTADLMSTIEDADMVAVMSDLAKEEAVYKNALSSSKRLIQPSLMDFLR